MSSRAERLFFPPSPYYKRAKGAFHARATRDLFVLPPPPAFSASPRHSLDAQRCVVSSASPPTGFRPSLPDLQKSAPLSLNSLEKETSSSTLEPLSLCLFFLSFSPGPPGLLMVRVHVLFSQRGVPNDINKWAHSKFNERTAPTKMGPWICEPVKTSEPVEVRVSAF